MFLRQLRWLVAGLAVVAAVCAFPTQSKADVQILVEELNTGGTVVASQFTSGAPNLFGNVDYTFQGSHFALSGSVATTSGVASSPIASLTPSFSGITTSAFNGTNTLRITVTDNAYTQNVLSGTLTNSAGASNGLTAGSVQVDTLSRIYAGPGSPSTNQTLLLADGPTLFGPTDMASTSAPSNPTLDNQTELAIGSLPSPFAIQQVLIVTFNDAPTGQQATFGGSGGASVLPLTTAVVPAPGGLVLALIALPLIGLRRTLRKRAVV